MSVVHRPRKEDQFGVWIRAWDVLLSLAFLLIAFVLVRFDAVKQLLELASNKLYFAKTPLLLDAHRHGYGFDKVRDHLLALGADGRAYYARSFLSVYDVALSVFLLTFSILLVLYATQKDKDYAISLPGWLRRVLVIPPILQFAFDVGENYYLHELMTDFPKLAPKVVETASQLTQLKWAAIYVNALIIMGLAGFTLYRWLQPTTTSDASPAR